jgi:hypothetical protein
MVAGISCCSLESFGWRLLMHVWECDFEGDLLFLEGWRDQWGERIVSFEALFLYLGLFTGRLLARSC